MNHTHVVFASHWIDAKLCNALLCWFGDRAYWKGLRNIIQTRLHPVTNEVLASQLVLETFVGKVLTAQLVTEEYDEGLEVEYLELTVELETLTLGCISFVVPTERVNCDYDHADLVGKTLRFSWQDKQLQIIQLGD